MVNYEDARAYLSGILEIMSKTESELVARLDELKDQRSYVESAINALKVLEHIPSKEE